MQRSLKFCRFKMKFMTSNRFISHTQSYFTINSTILYFPDNKNEIPESLANRLANSSEVTAENIFKHFLKYYRTQKSDESAKRALFDILNPQLPKGFQTPTTQSSFGDAIDESYETSTQATSTIDFLPNHDDDDDDDDTETDSETDYESSGQKNWNDTTILLDEDSDRNNV